MPLQSFFARTSKARLYYTVRTASSSDCKQDGGNTGATPLCSLRVTPFTSFESYKSPTLCASQILVLVSGEAPGMQNDSIHKTNV